MGAPIIWIPQFGTYQGFSDTFGLMQMFEPTPFVTFSGCAFWFLCLHLRCAKAGASPRAVGVCGVFAALLRKVCRSAATLNRLQMFRFDNLNVLSFNRLNDLTKEDQKNDCLQAQDVWRFTEPICWGTQQRSVIAQLTVLLFPSGMSPAVEDSIRSDGALQVASCEPGNLCCKGDNEM